ncbi:MAG: hypothetical protein CMQ16_10135 [Gammaproteobacteria bacterium]|nr:hypothetical protein [Gammaproteobacteria bacterium]
MGFENNLLPGFYRDVCQDMTTKQRYALIQDYRKFRQHQIGNQALLQNPIGNVNQQPQTT